MKRSISRVPHRVLLVHPAALGDVLTVLPLAGVLKQRWPAVKVFLCGTAYARPLVECCAHVDAFVDADAALRDANVLRDVHADVVINPYPSYPLMRVAHAAGIPVRIGNLRRPKMWLHCNRFVAYSSAHSRDHIADIGLQTLRALGICTRVADHDARTLYGLTRLEPLEDRSAALLASDRFNLILHPKSGGEGREWPACHYMDLVAMLPRGRFRVFVTGVAREGEVLRRECPALFDHEDVIDLTGRLPLKQLIAFAARADGMVASGTGPLHIAAALGVHALGIFPPTPNINAQRWAPIGPRAECLGLSACPQRGGCTHGERLGSPCACTAVIMPAQVAARVACWLETGVAAPGVGLAA